MDLPPTVVVRWRDAIVFSGWEHFDPEVHQARRIISVGLLVDDNVDQITIATSFDGIPGPGGHWGNMTVIPRVAIDSIEIKKD